MLCLCCILYLINVRKKNKNFCPSWVGLLASPWIELEYVYYYIRLVEYMYTRYEESKSSTVLMYYINTFYY